jgi:hypothetical protein
MEMTLDDAIVWFLGSEYAQLLSLIESLAAEAWEAGL